MPEVIKRLPQEFFDNIENMTFQEIAYTVADAFFGEDVEAEALKKIVYDTLAFDCPVVKVEDGIYALELFPWSYPCLQGCWCTIHGTIAAIFHQGARSRSKEQEEGSKEQEEGEQGTRRRQRTRSHQRRHGSARCQRLPRSGWYSCICALPQRPQDTQGKPVHHSWKNITAIEVDGVFDDCQALVKNAFMDEELNRHMRLTSANSINVARFLPQAFYYFNAYARIKASHLILIVVRSIRHFKATSDSHSWVIRWDPHENVAPYHVNDILQMPIRQAEV